MKKINKGISAILACVMLLSCLSFPAFATFRSDDNIYPYTFNGEPICGYLYDEYGNLVIMPRFDYGKTVMPNGYVKRFYNSQGEGFSFVKGTVVDFSVTFTTKALFELGYTLNGTDHTIMEISVATTGFGGTVKIPETGKYTFWVKNTSADTKTLESASITTA